MNIDSLPAFEQVVTKDYIDQVLESGKWNPHGSDIDRYFEDADAIECLDDDSVAEQHLREVYFPNRFRFVMEELSRHLDDLSEDPHLLRAMHIPTSDWGSFKSKLGKQPLGVFWSVHQPETHGTVEKRGIHVTIKAKFNPEQVDWVETIRSRMDYDLGDDEEEIQLLKYAIPDVVDFEFNHAPQTSQEHESALDL